MTPDDVARSLDSWVDVHPDDPFGLQTLPFGSFTADHLAGKRVGVRIGNLVLDLTAAAHVVGSRYVGMFEEGTLDRFLAAGPDAWSQMRAVLTDWLTDPKHRDQIEPLLVPIARCELLLPFSVADFVDFYASEHHASNLGKIFRPGQPPLTENWKSLPVGYHGRAGSVVVSGTPIVRPCGQRRRSPDEEVTFGPSLKLDIEAELGFVVGTPSRMGSSIGLDSFSKHVFGVCLVNDWSARDIQAFEYVPLGPFLGKSFGTSISPWIVPLSALQQAQVKPPQRDPTPLAYLDDSAREPWGMDITLEVSLNGEVISRPPFSSTYWTAAQQLAHLTANGASVRAGDLFASGTISGPEGSQLGSLIELTWNGQRPLSLADGSTREFLEDGDEVVITATAPGPRGTVVGLGEVAGRIMPALGGETA